MIELLHAVVAEGTVLRSRWTINLAGVAPPHGDLDPIHELVQPQRRRPAPCVGPLRVKAGYNARLRERSPQEVHQRRSEQQQGRHAQDRCRDGQSEPCVPWLRLIEERQTPETEGNHWQAHEGASAQQHRWLGTSHQQSVAEEPIVPRPETVTWHELRALFEVALPLPHRTLAMSGRSWQVCAIDGRQPRRHLQAVRRSPQDRWLWEPHCCRVQQETVDSLGGIHVTVVRALLHSSVAAALRVSVHQAIHGACSVFCWPQLRLRRQACTRITRHMSLHTWFRWLPSRSACYTGNPNKTKENLTKPRS
mmetsp:Transcript_12658/g.35028  ORF Transcript_12658/g.35028 Transcript_12658/m.35028 type:complete len:307 (-) Transcript_12658:22-942(-)